MKKTVCCVIPSEYIVERTDSGLTCRTLIDNIYIKFPAPYCSRCRFARDYMIDIPTEKNITLQYGKSSSSNTIVLPAGDMKRMLQAMTKRVSVTIPYKDKYGNVVVHGDTVSDENKCYEFNVSKGYAYLVCPDQHKEPVDYFGLKRLTKVSKRGA